MARYPLRRVPKRPPYVLRPRADRALANLSNDVFPMLFLIGQGPRRGVSRTLRRFLEEVPQRRFTGPRDRYPVSIDLYDGLACLSAVEILIHVRNSLVHTVNRAGGVGKLGGLLFAFDGLYTLWKDQERVEPEDAIPLTPTLRTKAITSAIKVVVTLASMGTVHVVTHAADIANVFEAMGWGSEAAADIGRERFVEGFYERRVEDAQEFIRRSVTPRISKVLRAALGSRPLDSAAIAMLMQDILLDTVSRVQAELNPRGKLLLLIDSIDEAVDDSPNTVSARFAIVSLALEAQPHTLPTTFAGRVPEISWTRETQSTPLIETMDLLPEHEIRVAFRLAGLSATQIDEIWTAVGTPMGVVAGVLSDYCQKHSVTWP